MTYASRKWVERISSKITKHAKRIEDKIRNAIVGLCSAIVYRELSLWLNHDSLFVRLSLGEIFEQEHDGIFAGC